nr:hypothetical protein [Shigella boydii]
MFAGKKSAQIREILISESAWEEMTCLFAPSLISFKKDREEMRTESVYYVQHRNKRSVLDQELIITGDLAFRTYKASMEMKDFPKCGSEREAALKLAEWMQRMAAAIENYWSEP